MGTTGSDEQDARWREYVSAVRDAPPPFEEQWKAFREIFAGRRSADGPPIVWSPAPETVERSNLARFWRRLGLPDYAALYDFSVRERARFWEAALDQVGIAFSRPPRAILEMPEGPRNPRWLPGARMNAVDSCFKADADAVAIVSGGEESDALRTVSYGELERLAGRVAGGLARRGLGPGARVALYMPMTVECVAAYLGVVRAGGTVVSVADSFPPSELKRRLEIARAEAIVTVDRFVRGGRPIALYRKVKEAAAPCAIVVAAAGEPAPDLRAGDVLWDDFLGDGEGAPAAQGDPHDVTNILFSSGTTADPKAIPWTHLTPLKCIVDAYFHQDVRPEDVLAWPTNIGWMMGPWLIYASLANRAAMALYEGLPTGKGFARFVARARVSVLGVVPSLVKVWRTDGSLEGVDWTGVRLFSSTGEASNQEDYLWLMSRTGYRAPVIEYCGGTEVGGGYITGTVVQPASPATFTTPALGLSIVILDEAGRPVSEGEMGEAFLIPPSIGLSQSLLNKDHDAVYYAGCPRGPSGEVLRRHGDQILRLARGFYKAQGRADDAMNLGGIKVGSVEIEETVNLHPAVRESAAVAVQPGGEGADRLVLFVVPRAPVSREALARDLKALIAERLNPLYKIHDLVIVEGLPRTASNKIMRRELRREYLTRSGR